MSEGFMNLVCGSGRYQLALRRGRTKKNASGQSSVSMGCRDCTKRAPATIVPGSHPSGAKGVARPPANCISGRFPQPVHITIRQSKASRRQAAITAPVSHQKRSQQDATNTIERVKSSGKSTPAILVPPLITVWLEVRILPAHHACFQLLFSLAFLRFLTVGPIVFDSFVRALAIASRANAACLTVRV